MTTEIAIVDAFASVFELRGTLTRILEQPPHRPWRSGAGGNAFTAR